MYYFHWEDIILPLFQKLQIYVELYNEISCKKSKTHVKLYNDRSNFLENRRELKKNKKYILAGKGEFFK